MASAEESRGTPAPENAMKRAFAAAMKEVLDDATTDALLNVRPEDRIKPDPTAIVLAANANPSGAWIHARARLEINAAADQRLTLIANFDGISGEYVERVYAELVKGTKLVVIKPAPGNDFTALPVTRYTGYSGAWVNLLTLLGPANLTLKTGYKKRYHLNSVPEGSPYWPALVLNLGKPLETRRITENGEGEGEGAGDSEDDEPKGPEFE